MIHRGELPVKLVRKMTAAVRRAARTPATIGEIEANLGMFGPSHEGRSLLDEVIQDATISGKLKFTDHFRWGDGARMYADGRALLTSAGTRKKLSPVRRLLEVERNEEIERKLTIMKAMNG